jgi:hypothetical protein
VPFAKLALQAPPGGVDLEERVLDEAPCAHWADYRSRALSAPPCRGRGR